MITDVYWRTRGIPWTQLKRVCGEIELTMEDYLAEAGFSQREVRQPKGQHTFEASMMMEDFEALPAWLKEHVARKTAQLRAYADALPEYVRDGMKGPPKDPTSHRAWELRIEADMEVKLATPRVRK